MQKSEVISRIQQLRFVCPQCQSLHPYTDILISVTPTKHNNNNNNQQPQPNTQPHPQPHPSPPTLQLDQSICLQCYKQSINQPPTKIYALKDILHEYIHSMPLPDCQLAEDCLQVLSNIEQKSKTIINAIYQSLDQIKFYILDLGRQVRNTCKKYTQLIKYHSQLQIQDFVNTWKLKKLRKHKTNTNNNTSNTNMNKQQASKLKKMLSLNQSSTLSTLSSYHTHLSSFLSSLPSLSLSIPPLPTLNSQPQARTRTKLSQIPISSVCIFNNTPFYGLSDGRILVSKYKQTKSYKAHDSLIRSFANNGEHVLYSGSDDFTIKAWNTKDDKGLECVGVFGVLGEGNKSYHRGICVLYNEWGCGNVMVSTRGQFDGFRIRLWDLNHKYENIGVLDGHDSFIRAIAIIDKTHNTIMTASDDKTLRTWNPHSHTLLQTTPRHRKPLNIIPSLPQISIICIIEQQNRFSLLDKQSLSPLLSITLARRILCSCGYSRVGKGDIVGYELFVVCVPGNVGMYGWDGGKVWGIDVELTYTPIGCVQYGDRLVLIDGSGVVEMVYVGNIQLQQSEHSQQQQQQQQEQAPQNAQQQIKQVQEQQQIQQPNIKQNQPQQQQQQQQQQQLQGQQKQDAQQFINVHQN